MDDTLPEAFQPLIDHPRPSHYNPRLQEALSAEQLKLLIAAVDPVHLGLGMVNIGHRNSAARDFEPWLLTLQGAINIHGSQHAWEAEIDIRMIEKAEDILTLVGQLRKSFDDAEGLLRKGGSPYVQKSQLDGAH